jgi:hypothetical protein
MDRKEQLRQLLSNTNALLEAMRFSARTATGEHANIGNFTGASTFIRKYDALARLAKPLLPEPSMLDLYDLSKFNKGAMSQTWIQAKEVFDMALANTSILKSLLEGAIGYAEDETHKLKDFIQANLRKALHDVPEKEVDVQNGIETLLVGRGMAKGTDYDRETGRVKSSGKETVADFIFPLLNLCLEVKLSKPGNLKAIVDEANADIMAYGKVYERQLYVIYDLGAIRDEAEFKRDLENVPGVSVLIVKH